MKTDWPVVPIWSVATEIRRIIEPSESASDFFHYSIPLVDETGTGRVESAANVGSAKLLLDGGEVLISKLNPRKGRVLISERNELPVVASPEFIALRPSGVIVDRFLAYLLSSETTRLHLDANVQSVTRSHQRVTPELVRHFKFLLPPIDEQRRIADFLDTETARIDGLAAARQRMRELLLLRRERTVEQIIGLDARPPMIPLKYVVQSVSVGIVITPANWYVDEGGVPALRGLNIQPGRIDDSNMVQISLEGHRENMKSRLSVGDVVVVRTGQAGAAAVVPAELDGSNCIDLLIIRLGRNTNSSFLTHYLNSFYARDKITEHSVGSIQVHFNVASMKNLEFPNIELAEQQRRAARLDELMGELDLLDSQLEAQLERLTERRQALITAAVAGGISV